MRSMIIRPTNYINGVVEIPGDKSISHRAILFSSLSKGINHITGCSLCNDCQSSLDAIQQLGIAVDIHNKNRITIFGQGLHGFKLTNSPVNCQRSGTTIRLLSGILAGQNFTTTLTGDPQLIKRPMHRVTEPLVNMGANITTTNGYAPIKVVGSELVGFNHNLSIASAQVKSAILLAGLFARGKTTINMPGNSRDHTEKMLQLMGANISFEERKLSIEPVDQLEPLNITIPGDISSAAYLMAISLLTKDSELTCKNVGINPTRTGLIDVLIKMGASIETQNERILDNEPVADIKIRSSSLHGIKVSGDIVVRMIDEFPIFAVLATQADGKTSVRNAAELRVKETDRIKTVASELNKLGANITTYPDGFGIEGQTQLSGDEVSSHGDHRLAMALITAGLISKKPLMINDVDCISDSYPGFFETLNNIGVNCD